MYAIEAAKVRPPPPPAVAAFESTLVPPDLKECWRNCKSIFVAASPDGLQGMLGGLVGGATLVPSSVGEKDGILDPANDVVMVEIRVLDRNPKEGSWEEKRLRSRVVEWLEDKQRREGWVKVYG